MFRISFIAIILLLSCGQKTDRGKPEVKEIVLEEIPFEPDTTLKPLGAFQREWGDWKKPNPDAVYLSDDVAKYLAEGHVSIAGSYGDIDQNGTLDLVIITGLRNEDSLRSTGKKMSRHLLVFLDQKDLSFRNDNALPCNNCCGKTDSYAGHAALSGQFVIRENCLKSKKYRSEYKFDYVPELKDWLLHTIVTETSGLKDDRYSVDTLTRKDFGKVSLKTFSMQNLKTKYK